MRFTTPALIRKNTPGLRKKLENIGYKLCLCTYGWGDTGNLFTGTDGEVHTIHDEDAEEFIHEIETGKSDCIDCGDDEELFLALARMPDDAVVKEEIIENLKNK